MISKSKIQFWSCDTFARQLNLFFYRERRRKTSTFPFMASSMLTPLPSPPSPPSPFNTDRGPEEDRKGGGKGGGRKRGQRGRGRGVSSKGRRAHSSETLMYNSYRPNASFVGVLAAHFTLHVFDGNPLKLTGFEPQHSPFIYASVCQHHLRQSSHQGGKLARTTRLRAGELL